MLPRTIDNPNKKSLPPLLNGLTYVWNIPRRTKLITICIIFSLQMLLYIGLIGTRTAGWSMFRTKYCYHVSGVKDDPKFLRAKCYVKEIADQYSNVQQEVTESRSLEDYKNILSALKAKDYGNTLPKDYSDVPFVYEEIGGCDSKASKLKFVGNEESLKSLILSRHTDADINDC